MTSGSALTWVKGMITTQHEFNSWSDFTTALKKRFEDPDDLKKKRNELLHLKVVDWDIRGFFTRFEELATIIEITYQTKWAKEVDSEGVYEDECLDDIFLDRIRAAMPKALDEAVETAWEAQRSMLEELDLEDQEADKKVKRSRQKG